MGVKKDILRVTGGEKIVDWDRHFGMGIYGAVLSITAGLLILIFPALVSIIVGLFLVLRGCLELFRYSKRKVVTAVKSRI